MPAVRVTGSLDRGFAIESRDGSRIHGFPSGRRVRLEGTQADGWVLSTAEDGSEGFVLRDGEDERAAEVGRTTRTARSDDGMAPVFLLLQDGRLFRIAVFDPRSARIELHGWEVPGAYLRARPEPSGWSVARTPAGGALETPTALWILFAAELLRAERT